jgi:hypothetical protein
MLAQLFCLDKFVQITRKESAIPLPAKTGSPLARFSMAHWKQEQ